MSEIPMYPNECHHGEDDALQRIRDGQELPSVSTDPAHEASCASLRPDYVYEPYDCNCRKVEPAGVVASRALGYTCRLCLDLLRFFILDTKDSRWLPGYCERHGLSMLEPLTSSVESANPTLSHDSTSGNPSEAMATPPIHKLKTWTQFFDDVAEGRKPFEIRKDDRGFAVGDILSLEEWVMAEKRYTGRATYKVVTYILRGEPWLRDGMCCMGIRSIGDRPVIRSNDALPAKPKCPSCNGTGTQYERGLNPNGSGEYGDYPVRCRRCLGTHKVEAKAGAAAVLAELSDAPLDASEKASLATLPTEPFPTFEEAWAKMAEQGYQYGEDALSHVRFGWEIHEAICEQRGALPLGKRVGQLASSVADLAPSDLGSDKRLDDVAGGDAPIVGQLGELRGEGLGDVDLHATKDTRDPQVASADRERSRIVAWLRWEADHRPQPTRQRLQSAADDIEAGAHLPGHDAFALTLKDEVAFVLDYPESDWSSATDLGGRLMTYVKALKDRVAACEQRALRHQAGEQRSDKPLPEPDWGSADLRNFVVALRQATHINEAVESLREWFREQRVDYPKAVAEVIASAREVRTYEGLGSDPGNKRPLARRRHAAFVRLYNALDSLPEAGMCSDSA